MNQLKIVFMGTATFSEAVLKNLIQHDYNIVQVVSQPDRRVGRKKELKMPEVKSQKRLPKLLLTVLSRLSAAAIRLLRRKPLRWQIKFLISLQAAVPSLNSLKARHCLLSQPFRKELSNSLF